jgi:hypothetical protein
MYYRSYGLGSIMGEEERKLKTKDRVLVYSDDPKDQAKMSGETDRIAIESLHKKLKAKCGVGGSFFVEENKGCIEIQGDKRDAIKKILDQKNLKYKGV